MLYVDGGDLAGDGSVNELVDEGGDGGVENEGDEEEEGEDAHDAEGAEDKRGVVLEVLQLGAGVVRLGLHVVAVGGSGRVGALSLSDGGSDRFLKRKHNCWYRKKTNSI